MAVSTKYTQDLSVQIVFFTFSCKWFLCFYLWAVIWSYIVDLLAALHELASRTWIPFTVSRFVSDTMASYLISGVWNQRPSYSPNTYEKPMQYADDIAIFIDDSTALQCLLSAYSDLSLKMDLRINIKKTETMSVGEQLDFFTDGHKLRRVDRFKYFGSSVTKVLIRNRLLWMGHVALMPDERPVKALLYGVLVLLLKDILKRGVALGTWREIITGRLARRRLASDICDKIEQEYREESQA